MITTLKTAALAVVMATTLVGCSHTDTTVKTNTGVYSNGDLLQGSGATIFVYENGVKRAITAPSVITQCVYQVAGVKKLDDAELAKVADGAPLGPDQRCP